MTLTAMRDNADQLFSGSIPQLYQQYLVPLIFQPYAEDIAARVAEREPAAVIAALMQKRPKPSRSREEQAFIDLQRVCHQ